MTRRIWIYGHGDKSTEGIPGAEAMVRYIREDIFHVFKRRYRHTQGKPADVVLLSQDGKMYGHLELAGKLPVTDEDRNAYSKVRHVYAVSSSALYAKPVSLSSIGSPRIQFGYEITEDILKTIEDLAGEIECFKGHEPSSPTQS